MSTFLIRTLHFQFKARTRLSAQHLADFRIILSKEIFSVYFHQDISRLQSRFGCRSSFERFGNHGTFQLRIIGNKRTDASKTSFHHLFQFALIFLRVIFCIRIQREKHIVDSFTNGLVRINSIHVEHIQFFHNRIKCIQILGNLEIAVVSTLKTKESYSSYYSHQNKSYPPIQQFFHISFIKMRRKSNSNLGYSARTLLIFNLISSQRSGEIVVPIT